MTPKVLGLDLSLTCTGLAGNGWTDTIKPGERRAADRDRRDKVRDARLRATFNHMRIAFIRGRLDDYLTGVHLVVMEGLAFDAHDTDRQLAGLSWIVRQQLWTRGVPYAVVSPSSLKQFVTGNGNAGKDLMVEVAAGWFGWFAGDHNEADAAGLMVMGHAYLGAPLLGPLGDLQREALAKSAWPLSPDVANWAPPDSDSTCRHELHGADGGACPGCGHDSHPIPAGPALASPEIAALPTMPLADRAVA